ncbi:outer membrane protein assembly factor BamB family protein [Thalassoroseus pseudoceratinae]|uniref:outer membrane protein assembly factor BamB family protein n=1 Tax=Thalassoroseus pseudoceratinae TaxID=2713176 RepID=UPI00197D09EC|nr:PQQ-binding-like beta-propeller repeat protein [Thalassoroseus pseudoceratinae]
MGRRLIAGAGLCWAVMVCGIASVSEAAEPSATSSPQATTNLRPGHDWPKFLGPDGTGVSQETNLLSEWPEGGPKVVWKQQIGTGYSAPSVRNGRLVIFHRLEDEEIIECQNAATGESIWKTSYPSTYSDPYGYNNGPRCTPLLTEERCFTYGAEGKLVCTDLQTGKQLWKRDVKADWKLPQAFFGIGCTPILEGDRLIVLVGGQPNSGVVAFDSKTGKTLWENVGKSTWDGVETGYRDGDTYKWTGEEQIVSYSSPIAATIHGKRHVLCLLRHGLVSLDPENGELRFKHWFRVRNHESVNAVRPVVIDGDKIFLTAAYKAGSVLLKVAADGKSVSELWKDRDNLQGHWSTPIEVDGYIYGFSGRHEHEGEFRCVSVKTGKVEWSTSGYEGDLDKLPILALNRRTGEVINRTTNERVTPPFFGRGSHIRVGNRFIILGEYGTLSLAEVNPKKYVELERTYYPEIHYPAWPAPVLSRGRLYLRSEDYLVCLELSAAK